MTAAEQLRKRYAAALMPNYGLPDVALVGGQGAGAVPVPPLTVPTSHPQQYAQSSPSDTREEKVVE